MNITSAIVQAQPVSNITRAKRKSSLMSHHAQKEKAIAEDIE